MPVKNFKLKRKRNCPALNVPRARFFVSSDVRSDDGGDDDVDADSDGDDSVPAQLSPTPAPMLEQQMC
jgi:hypothetical protein